ncbi:MAG: type II toxin-antitoxin system Phd/YefM family antitoxin [Chloroflexi bacterium]|nr:type II toxin-antitoxin system Phd/YefM family antitoxin [Chloroflexota bacterium]
MKRKRARPQIVLQDGKPSAVIIAIDEYRDMLERLEDLEDLRALEQMRKGKLTFRSLEDILEEYDRDVPGPPRTKG